MAKLSGPEEFFEVFREKQPEEGRSQQPVGQIPIQAPPSFRQEKTVTLKVRTLVIAGTSSVLLMVLSYLVGAAGRPEQNKGPLQAGGGRRQQERQGLPGGRGVDDAGLRAGQTNGTPPVDGRTDTDPSRRGKYVLRIITYRNTATGRKLAGELELFLKEHPVLSSHAVSVGADVRPREGIVIYVGPFDSRKSSKAKVIKEAVKKMRYKGQPLGEPAFMNSPR